MSRLLDNLLIFGRLLRRAGVDVHRGRLLDVVDALGHVNLGERGEVYHACRALLVHRHEQIALFDVAFASFWREHDGREARHAPQPGESRASVVVFEDDLARDDVSEALRRDAPDDDAAGDARRTEDLERPRRSGRQGFRRVHERRNRRSGRHPVASRLEPW